MLSVNGTKGKKRDNSRSVLGQRPKKKGKKKKRKMEDFVHFCEDTICFDTVK